MQICPHSYPLKGEEQMKWRKVTMGNLEMWWFCTNFFCCILDRQGKECGNYFFFFNWKLKKKWNQIDENCKHKSLKISKPTQWSFVLDPSMRHVAGQRHLAFSRLRMRTNLHLVKYTHQIYLMWSKENKVLTYLGTCFRQKPK